MANYRKDMVGVLTCLAGVKHSECKTSTLLFIHQRNMDKFFDTCLKHQDIDAFKRWSAFPQVEI
jgi:hypothetical protein